MQKYCWIITYHLDTIDPPVFLSTNKKHLATEYILPLLINKMKAKYPKVKWEEINLEESKTVGITEYGIEAIGNPNLYVKVFRSDYQSYIEPNFELK